MGMVHALRGNVSYDAVFTKRVDMRSLWYVHAVAVYLNPFSCFMY